MKPRRSAAKPAKVEIKVLRLDHGFGLPLPEYQSAGAAGVDLTAAIAASEPLLLEPFERALVPTGLALQIPAGFEAQVRPRSGLAWRHGITVLNSPGTIDSDYRGEVQVLLVNLGNRAVMIERGERIAQLVVAGVARAVLNETASLHASGRGAAGFGSTGRTATASRAKTAQTSGEKAATSKAGAKGRRSKTARSSAKSAAKKPAAKRAAKPGKATTGKKRARPAVAKSAAKGSPKRTAKAKSPPARVGASRQKVKPY